MMSEERTYKRKHLPFRQLGPHFLIVHGRNSMTLKTNDVGGVIWKTLEDECDLKTVVAALKAEYPDVDDNTLTNDAQEFLDQLLETTAIDVIKGSPYEKKPQLRKLESIEEHLAQNKGEPL